MIYLLTITVYLKKGTVYSPIFEAGDIREKDGRVSASHWNGLQVFLKADGSVVLYPEQMKKIIEIWE